MLCVILMFPVGLHPDHLSKGRALLGTRLLLSLWMVFKRVIGGQTKEKTVYFPEKYFANQNGRRFFVVFKQYGRHDVTIFSFAKKKKKKMFRRLNPKINPKRKFG